MVSRKRDRAEMESTEPIASPSMLTRLRNMWEFSNIMQYIFIFGKAVKIDEDFTIEVHASTISQRIMNAPVYRLIIGKMLTIGDI